MSDDSDQKIHLNGQDHLACQGHNLLPKLVERIDNLIKDHKDYRETNKVGLQQVASMYAALTKINGDTVHLSQLPKIASSNSEMQKTMTTFCREFVELKKDTMSTALGKKQVPLSVFLLVIGTLCIIGILRELGHRDLEASLTHLGIKSHPNEAQSEPEKKIN